MTSEEIFKLEFENKDRIHLLLAGKFWQAWEMSAYQFIKHFFTYQIHPKFIKKISAEMVYLGFSVEALNKVQNLANEKKFQIKEINPKHLEISGFTPFMGFADWKKERFATSGPSETESKNLKEKSSSLPETPNKKNLFQNHSRNLLYAYKEFYELTKYIFARTVDTAKGYKYGLCDNLRKNCLKSLDHLQMSLSEVTVFDWKFMAQEICKIRIKVRLLFDLKQISVNQWFYVCDKISIISKTLRLESFGLWVKGENSTESGSPLEIEEIQNQ